MGEKLIEINTEKPQKIKFRLKPIGGLFDGLVAEGLIIGRYSRDYYKVLVGGNVLVVEKDECLEIDSP